MVRSAACKVQECFCCVDLETILSTALLSFARARHACPTRASCNQHHPRDFVHQSLALVESPPTVIPTVLHSTRERLC